jgi:multidrug resistance efflux pump
MMRKAILPIIVSLAVLGLVGCAAQGGGEAELETQVETMPDISVTGEVVPAVWANVSAQKGGTVVDVLVEPGDTAEEGEPLARLDITDAELAVQQAEASLDTARAQLALLEADPRQAEVAAAEAGISGADAMVSQAAAERNRLASGAIAAEIAAAESAVAQAEAFWKDALIHYEDIQSQGEDAEEWIRQEAALRFRAAEQSLQAAQMRLTLLQATVEARLREADAMVDAAETELRRSQVQLDMLNAGATEEQIAVAQAGVLQAQAALDAAMLALERSEVRAPFAGTIGQVNARTGELIVAGQQLVTLGDLTTLRVETTDLDEIDVAHVYVGQQVDVSFDALQEMMFAGEVTRISPMAAPGSGGVNYTVVIELDEIHPAVRWGMTAFVDIEVEG